MIPIQLQPLVDHLWQSTVCALVAGALTLALKSNRARVRYRLWFAASVKFLVPFSLLTAAGRYFGRHSIVTVVPSRLPIIADRLTQSLVVSPSIVMTTPASAAFTSNLILAALGLVWTIGFIVLISSWWVRWRRLREVLTTASPVQLPINLKAVSSPAFMEPGVFGIYDPILLLPEGITEKLTPLEFETILLHEMSHVRRRDNLGTAIHMLVEAVFWFHPLVWFLGMRLVDERERACDEDVLRAGNQPYVYAEGVLKVCELYLQSPLRCISGVTGSNLKTRIQAILAGRIGCDLSFSKRTVLTTAAILALAMPIAVGIIHAAPVHFEVASVKRNDSELRPDRRLSPGNLAYTSVTLAEFIQWAYDFPYSRISAPRWMYGERYTIIAKAGTAAPATELKIMLQSLLEERFRLKLHREFRDVPFFNLIIAKKGSKLKPTADPAARSKIEFRSGKMEYTNGTVGDIVGLLGGAQSVGRPVVDRTGLTGRYDFAINMYDLQVSSGNLKEDVATSLSGSVNVVMDDLGLRLESAKGPLEFLVIDEANRIPMEN